MKLAIVSRPLPPSFTGQAMMLYRLLKDVPPENYCLISAASQESLNGKSYSHKLSAKYFYLSRRVEITRGEIQQANLLWQGLNLLVGSYSRAVQIARIVREEGCKAVLACSSGNDLLDVPSGFIASRFAQVPFYVYLFDTYSHMWAQPKNRFIGRRLEPIILRRAKGIIATNESVRDLLQRLYGVDSWVIHNPCDLSAYESAPATNAINSGGELKIVYTGAIYEAHHDPLVNLTTALDLINRPNIKLHLYTSADPATLEKKGIKNHVVVHEHQPIFSMPLIQQQADVLFLPLGFRSPWPELINVSSPSKVGEFLAARRPILVHAPPDSFLARYFREHDCGVVVDRDDPQLLADAIERLLADGDLRQRVTANAWNRAVLDFSLTAAQAKFTEIFGLSSARDPNTSGELPSG